VVEGSSLEN